MHGWKGPVQAAVSGSCFHSAQVVATEPPRSEQGGFPPLLRGGAPVAGCLHFGSVGCEFVGEAISFLHFL